MNDNDNPLDNITDSRWCPDFDPWEELQYREYLAKLWPEEDYY